MFPGSPLQVIGNPGVKNRIARISHDVHEKTPSPHERRISKRLSSRKAFLSGNQNPITTDFERLPLHLPFLHDPKGIIVNPHFFVPPLVITGLMFSFLPKQFPVCFGTPCLAKTEGECLASTDGNGHCEPRLFVWRSNPFEIASSLTLLAMTKWDVPRGNKKVIIRA